MHQGHVSNVLLGAALCDLALDVFAVGAGPRLKKKEERRRRKEDRRTNRAASERLPGLPYRAPQVGSSWPDTYTSHAQKNRSLPLSLFLSVYTNI